MTFTKNTGNNSHIVNISGSLTAEEIASTYINQSAGSLSALATIDTTPSIICFSTATTDTLKLYFRPGTNGIAIGSANINYNSYSGNTASGSNFALWFNGNFPDPVPMEITLNSSYTAGSPINSTLTVAGKTQSLESSYVFGNLATLNGNPLVTFVNGDAVPEPSTSLLGVFAVACLFRRRRA